MKIIAITGKSGSGKSSLAKKLAEVLECKYVDIDKIGHEALYNSRVKDELCAAFGEQILVNDVIDRKEVGKVVFANKEKMDKLTEITWDYMQELIDPLLNGIDEYIVLDWALLPNSKYWKVAHRKIIVYANEKIRKEKIMERDNISEDYYNLREAASWDYRNETFDIVVTNDYTEESFNEMLRIIIDDLKNN